MHNGGRPVPNGAATVNGTLATPAMARWAGHLPGAHGTYLPTSFVVPGFSVRQGRTPLFARRAGPARHSPTGRRQPGIKGIPYCWVGAAWFPKASPATSARVTATRRACRDGLASGLGLSRHQKGTFASTGPNGGTAASRAKTAGRGPDSLERGGTAMAAAINHRPAHPPARAPPWAGLARRRPDRQAAESPGRLLTLAPPRGGRGCSLRFTREPASVNMLTDDIRFVIVNQN